MDKIDKNEIIDIVNKEIIKFEKDLLDKTVMELVKNKNSKTRNELVDLIKKSLESVYKLLWQKREFWKNDIK